MNDPANKTTMCDDCKRLVGAHRHAQPHSNLVSTDFKEINSMFGSVNEHYYECRVCHRKWMHETGSYGQGWM